MTQDTPTRRFCNMSRRWAEKKPLHQNFTEGSSSLACPTTLSTLGRTNQNECSENTVKVANFARKIAHRRWSFGPGNEDKWYLSSDPKVTPYSNRLSHRKRGRSNVNVEKKTIHFNADQNDSCSESIHNIQRCFNLVQTSAR